MKEYLFVIIFILSVYENQAQENNELNTHYFWLNSGIGKSLIRTESFTNLGVGATYLFKNKIALHYENLSIRSNISSNSWRKFSNHIIALGLNKSFKKTNSLIVFAGTSFGRGLYLGEYIKPDSSGSGLGINFIFGPPKKEADFEQSRIRYNSFYSSVQYLVRINYIGLSFRYYLNVHRFTDHGLSVILHLGFLNND